MVNAATHPQFEQVNALYEERQRFESWLAALEAKRATTPVHIFARVQGDYGARLQRVVEELRTHRTGLQELERTLIDRLSALDSEEAKHRDEAAEAELRAMVGELSSEHLTEVTVRTGAAIEGLSEERSRVQAELSELRHLLDVGTAPLPVGTVTDTQRAEVPAAELPRVRMAEPSSASAAPPHDWQLGFEHAGASPNVPPRNVGSRSTEKSDVNPFDDLEFLKTMVDRTSDEHGAVSSVPPALAREPEAVVSSPAARSPTSSGTPPRIRTSQPAPVVASGLPLIMPDSPAPHHPQPGARDSVPTYLKDSPPEQVKTLKCQECGTLNYPTEWYCERCGAELAAL